MGQTEHNFEKFKGKNNFLFLYSLCEYTKFPFFSLSGNDLSKTVKTMKSIVNTTKFKAIMV